MSSSLFIVITNPKPNREQHYPRTWLLYTQGKDPVEVHVSHDNSNKPHVLDRGAA